MAKRYVKMYRVKMPYTFGDGSLVVPMNQLVAEDSPEFKAIEAKARHEIFAETDLVRPTVEQATAAPGEER